MTRGTGHTLDDVASENERRSDEELARDAGELRGYLNGPRLAIGGPGLEAAAWEREVDIKRVQGNREEGREDSANRGGLRAGAQKAGEGLLATADATGALRRGVSEALPVSEEVENSLGGQMVAAIAQMPANLAMYRVPGLGPLMSAGQVYNETYYDALAHGATPKQAHRAAMNGLPAAAVDVAMDKLMLARILKPLAGKMKVKELRKTLFLTGLTGGVSEGLQQAVMNFNAKYLSGYDPERLLDEDVIRSLVIGMLVDSTVSAGGQVVVSGRARAETRSIDPEKREVSVKAEGDAPPAEPVFSKTNKPQGSADIDDSPKKAYEKVISEDHSSIPEYLADQSRAFGVAAEAADGGVGTGAGTGAPESSGGRNLSDWAKAKGTLISAEDLAALPVLSESTSEHVVRLDVGAHRVVKTTKDLYYGEIPVVREGQVTSEGAWPAEYLRRMQLQIAVFGSDLRLEGIHVPSESLLLEDPADAPQIVISQPWYESVGNVTESDVAAYMQDAGFLKVPESFEAWLRPSDGVLVQDAFPDNFVLTEAGLVPLDLQMNVLTQEELGQIEDVTGQSGISGVDITPRRSTEVREWTNSVLQSWGSKLDVVVHDSAEGIADARLREAVQEQGGNVEAFFDPKDGRIHLLADRVGSKADAERLLRHEGIHWAVRGAMRKEYGALLEQYGRQVPYEKLQSVIAKYPEGSPDLWIEEYLAELGQSNPKSSLWRQFVSAFKQLLREKWGTKIEFTDEDVLAFLTRANRKLERATEAETNHHFDGSDASDPLYSKKKKGPQRESWDQVRKGDSWNSVKKLLPKENVEAPVFPTHGTKDEIVERAAEFLKANSVVTDWTGRVVYLPYGQTRGSYSDPVKNRAEHLIAKDLVQGTHDRELRVDKAKWLAAVPDTIKTARVRVFNKVKNTMYYFKSYKEKIHMVTTSGEGVVQDQQVYDSGLVTQYPIDSKEGFPNAVVSAIRPPAP